MKKEIFIIVCEGKSENNYLQMLNRFLQEKEIDIYFKPKEVGTGFYNEVETIYKEEYKNNKKTKIEIWVDNDIYKRNEKESTLKYKNKPKTIPDFKFNYFNFEDFLSMHLDDEKFNEWQDICKEKKIILIFQ